MGGIPAEVEPRTHTQRGPLPSEAGPLTQLKENRFYVASLDACACASSGLLSSLVLLASK